MSEYVLIALGAIVGLGFAAQWLAWQLKIPSILFLLLFGLLAGPVLGYLDPDTLFGQVLIPFVSISVAIILFEGGLTLKISEFKKIGSVVVLLISAGAIITGVVTTVAAYLLLDLNFQVSVLLGAVLTVTGPTVIGPMLRNIRPQKNVGNILKWEGILIDPIGALITILVFEVILIGEVQEAAVAVVFSFTKTVLAGMIMGGLFAFSFAFVIKKYWIPDYLAGTASLAFVVILFVVSNAIQEESGLLACTIMGIVLANQKYASVKRIRDFKENLTLLIIPVLFILLSARLTVADVELLLTPAGVFFLLLLIFIGRPLAVWAATLNSGLKTNEKLFVSFIAPRGIVAAAVSSVFALKLEDSTIPQTEYLVPVTFFVIIGTVIIYGFTSPVIAKWLKISQSDPQGVLIAGGQEWALQIAAVLQEKKFNVIVVDTNRQHINNAKMMGLAAYNESVIGDKIIDEVNLEGIGKLLALTSNDEVNALSVLHFSEIFDKSNLYQLVPNNEKDEITFSPEHLRGRFLFGKGIHFTFLSNKFAEGAGVKSTNLTEEFTFEDFRTEHGNEVIPLFVINNRNNKLIPFTVGDSVKPEAGNTIVALAMKKEKS
jgi:NhaP-type Na+/H+ or K+/H+ antiporter